MLPRFYKTPAVWFVKRAKVLMLVFKILVFNMPSQKKCFLIQVPCSLKKSMVLGRFRRRKLKYYLRTNLGAKHLRHTPLRNHDSGPKLIEERFLVL